MTYVISQGVMAASTTLQTRKQLNGIDLKKFEELVETAKKDPQAAKALNNWSARVQWLGGFKSQIYARGHSGIISDEPFELVGSDTGPNAVEYILGALGSCLTVGYVANASAKGIKIDSLEIGLDGEIDNILTFLGLSEEGHPGYKKIRVKVNIKSANATPEQLQELHEYVLKTSPVGNTLSRNVQIEAELGS
jgi:uncharacterized OsmC-like protein